ncbi:outer membrane protein OmpA-like peptidoglycan-associated protein [Methylobacterium goesingense]|uniref:Outer membrane protein OmpA-like peptidoglycan-associated protein n=1 Tax=Methylobacterium goesingense TaxID=243690 RepID=A0ABV2KZM4_9HYPH
MPPGAQNPDAQRPDGRPGAGPNPATDGRPDRDGPASGNRDPRRDGPDRDGPNRDGLNRDGLRRDGGDRDGIGRGEPGRPDLRPGDTRRDDLDRRGGADRRDDRDGLDRRGVDDRREDRERRDAFERREPRTGFNAPGRPGYIPGGFRDDDDVRDYDQVRRDRREFSEGGRTYIREPGRIIVRDRDNYFIRHDENERFRDLDRRAYRSERRGGDTITYLDRPGGEQIVTIVDDDGRLVRRSRRFRDGREVVIIDNSFGGGARRPIYDDVVDLPPPDIRIPRNRYVVDYDGADEGAVYEALSAPPVVAVDRRYTLDQVRYSPQLRARMRSVDIDTINFDTGSFTVTPDQASRLATIAAAMNRAIKGNPQEVFLIEGYTDAVGADVDNLSLSDRRAQSVATVLTQNFGVPPENLTTQGYGEQNLKVNTQNASRENRRVTVRRITPLIQQQGEAAPPPAPAPR